MNRLNLYSVVLAVILSSLSLIAYGQYDSSYIESYRGYVMPRLMLNRKSSGLSYHNEAKGYSLRYQPNKTFNLGVGVTYKFVTLKVGVGLLQPHIKRGETRDFDIQFHSYGRKFTIDFLAQFYKGFYLPDRRFGTPLNEFYVRPDLAVSALGGSFQYVFNHRKFSYRAAFQQTEFQKKSAGSLLLGVELFMGRFRADSTIVPAPLQQSEPDNLEKMRFIEIGPNVGYAYTWVYKKFFVTGGASLSFNAGLNRYYDSSQGITFTGVSPNTVIRISTGYSVKRWGINLLFLSTALRLAEFDERSVVFNAGTMRLNLIYRMFPNKNMRKMLRPIDKVEKRLKD